MRKFLASLVLGAMLVAPLQVSADYDAQTATSYLQAHADSPWTAMALKALGALNQAPEFLKSASGSSAIEYAAPILAITSFGQDPRTFGNDDLVAKLKSYHNAGQIGDPATLNDDVFGLLALVASGEPSANPIAADAKNFILTHQKTGGGWGFAVTGGTDSNLTATAITALISSGISADNASIQNGLTYLKSAQNDDGGFTYDPNSQYGTASDASSTAWVVWALTAAGISPQSWSKSGNSPIDYLKSIQAPGGYFPYQQNSGEDAFSPVTTAYAVIALAGKTLPANKISISEKFNFRIEGKNTTVCRGAAEGPTALDVAKNASRLCGFTYHIQDTNFGPYLDQIGGDKAEGLIGWIYLVNNASPEVGAADYSLRAGDSVLWYYGDFAWRPARLALSAPSIEKTGTAKASVETYSQGQWTPLPHATVFFGANTVQTDSAGQADIAPPQGFYSVYAEKDGYVRTNAETLRVGEPSGNQMNLSVEITDGEIKGGTLSFLVNPDNLDFGPLAPGETGQKDFAIKNTGTVTISLAGRLSGAGLFLDNLKLENRSWRNYKAQISTGQTRTASAELFVPSDYQDGSGVKTATLTFWATNN